MTLPRMVSVFLLAVLTGSGLGAVPAQSATSPPVAQGVGPVGDEPAHAAVSLPVDRRPPQSASNERSASNELPQRSVSNEPPPRSASSERSVSNERSGREVAAECNVADFTGRTGSALVSFVKTSTTACVNTLFSLTGSDAYNAFREAQMVSVAYGLRDNAAGYPGNNSTGTAQLTLYLRAGYYVQWYNASTVGTYGPALRTAIQSGLDGFFGNSHAFDVTDANGQTLAEAVILIDSSQQNARYLNVVKRLLSGYNSSYNASWSMLNAVNSVYTVLFRGHQVPEFVTAVQSDPSVLDTLYNFASSHLDLLSGPQSYLTSNAGRELARFVRHAAMQTKVRPLAKGLLLKSSLQGPTAALWVGVAEMTDLYDKANCAYYDTCNLQTRLLAETLPINHTCSSTLRIRAQQMTSSELSATCTSLLNQDAYFHGIVADPGPVANDRNSSLEVVAYNSSTDYKTYAGATWGIDTNNGGIYLEGNPAAAGNQARFIAYEAEWLRPTFEIWNLNHEYTHYLDGRFDMYGDFSANISTPTVWWIEGFAEYVSYSYRNRVYTAAITEAGRRTYALSTLFDTTYSHDSTRVYRWGYLAVRYMLQSHRSDMTTLLGYYRTGNWTAARTFLKSTIGSRYDTDWYNWLSACAAGSCGGGGGNQAPSADFTAAVTGLTAVFTDRSTDSDGTIASRRWEFGDGTTSTAFSPTKTYASAGTYTVRLTVTDNQGATGTVSRPVSVGGSLPECSGGDVRTLGQNCQRSGRGATAGNYDYLYVYLPAGVTQLRIASAPGTGNCDLYYNPGTWATTTAYTQRSTNSGNTESVTVSNPTAGYHYVSLHGATACGGVTVSSQY